MARSGYLKRRDDLRRAARPEGLIGVTVYLAAGATRLKQLSRFTVCVSDAGSGAVRGCSPPRRIGLTQSEPKKVNRSPKPGFSGPELCALEAHEVVALLSSREVSPKELLDAAFERLAAVEPHVNAVPTLCEERAYAACESVSTPDEPKAGVLCGLPIAIKDLTPVAGVRTTYGTLAADIASEPLVNHTRRRVVRGVGKSNTPV